MINGKWRGGFLCTLAATDNHHTELLILIYGVNGRFVARCKKLCKWRIAGSGKELGERKRSERDFIDLAYWEGRSFMESYAKKGTCRRHMYARRVLAKILESPYAARNFLNFVEYYKCFAFTYPYTGIRFDCKENSLNVVIPKKIAGIRLFVAINVDEGFIFVLSKFFEKPSLADLTCATKDKRLALGRIPPFKKRFICDSFHFAFSLTSFLADTTLFPTSFVRSITFSPTSFNKEAA